MSLTRIENRLNELDTQQSLIHRLFEQQVKKSQRLLQLKGELSNGAMTRLTVGQINWPIICELKGLGLTY